MDNLIQWRDVGGANIQLFRDEADAGHGRCWPWPMHDRRSANVCCPAGTCACRLVGKR
jgi:hypothetical protein